MKGDRADLLFDAPVGTRLNLKTESISNGGESFSAASTYARTTQNASIQSDWLDHIGGLAAESPKFTLSDEAIFR